MFSVRSHKMSGGNPFSFGAPSKPTVSVSSEAEDDSAPVTALCRAAAESIGGVARDLQHLQVTLIHSMLYCLLRQTLLIEDKLNLVTAYALP